jgi:hypothetical protein
MFNPYFQDETGYLRFEFFEGRVFAHAEINIWNKKELIKCRAVWEEAKKELKELGYPYIYIHIPTGDLKLVKFEKIFGFMKVTEINNIIIMACSTEEVWA